MSSRLKGYRVMAGLTQEDMAEAIQVNRPYYTLKENGNKFSTEQTKTIFRVLKKKLPSLKYEEVFPVDE